MMPKANEWIYTSEFIRTRTIQDLGCYCIKARKFILETLNETGGHLASNLGTIETIMAMHFVLDYHSNIFIFDTGHQAYLHKLLTSRPNELKSLGSYNGWSTFPSTTESKYDRYSPGHAGTSLSTSIGYLWSYHHNQNNTEKSHKKTIVLLHIGDSAFTNGLFLQALNDEWIQNKKLIIILNDNNMAIGPITGFFARQFKRIRAEQNTDLPNHKITKKFRDWLAFLNIEYINVKDGHDVASVISGLRVAIKLQCSTVLVHVHTIKGYGYLNTTSSSSPYNHKVKKNFYIPIKNPSFDNALTTFTDQIRQLIFLHYQTNQKIFLVFAGSSFGNNFNFIYNYDNRRFRDVGIAEEHGLLLCSALAIQGQIPIYYIYSTFLQRCFDQLIHDVHNPKLKIILLVSRAGISDFEGITHHGIYDIGMLSALSWFTIIAPSDQHNMKLALNYSINIAKNSSAIRFGNQPCPKKSTQYQLKTLTEPIWIDSYENLKSCKVIIITYGSHINQFHAVITAGQTKDICLINALFLCPIDLKMFKKIIVADKQVIIYEHTILENGLIKIINNVLSYNKELQRIAIKHNWYRNYRYYGIVEKHVYHGSRSDFLRRNNLNYQKIISDTLNN